MLLLIAFSASVACKGEGGENMGLGWFGNIQCTGVRHYALEECMDLQLKPFDKELLTELYF